MRVLVCRGRDFSDAALVEATLRAIHRKVGIEAVITGGTRGADRLGEHWAEANGVAWVQYPVQWEVHSRSAGPRRSEQMLREGKPDGVVAFPSGVGTTHMVRIAKAAGGQGLGSGAQAVKTLSLQEAAILLQVHPETLRGWAKEGRAPGAKLGKSWLFIDTDLLDWVRSAYSSHTTSEPPCPSTSLKTPLIGHIDLPQRAPN